jgi:UDP-glucose 4-epimerase
VAVSSVAAIRSFSPDPILEDTPPAPDTPYGESKRAMERALLEVATAGGIRLPILRPPMVYGPGHRGNAERFFTLVRRGWPVPSLWPAPRRSLCFVRNLVSALTFAAEHAAVATGTYLVADDASVTIPELAAAIGAALGVKARVVRVPGALVRFGAGALDVVGGLVPTPASGHDLRRVLERMELRPERLRRAGWVAPFAWDEGVRLTADSMREVTEA